MSVHWSSEFSKWEFRDLQATAMAVDWSGKNIILAGKRCLTIKHLSQDDNGNNDSVKKILRQSKYDVAGAEWCQTQHGQRLCAISSNQRVDIYHWRNGDLTGMHSLRGHTRVVSDTHWHREDHNLIATCSIDTFTHLWDLRDTRKPVLSLSAVAGASQVQWNKVASHLLATAHDGDVKLWDKRKGSSPIQYISAHLCKIHGLDWSPHHDYQLVTSSHDGTIKFFNINNPRKVESVITTNYPVWKAIYTPFGNGVVTMGVGWGSVSRGDQAGVIGIWVGGSLAHRLVGHTDVVLQMQWRPTSDQSNYQLITWARDQSLRIWMMPRSLLKMCYHYLPFDDNEDDSLSDNLSYQSANEYPDPSISDAVPMTKLSTYEPILCLKEEFESIRNLENISVTDVDLDHKTCNVKTESSGHVAILKVAFPVTYTFDLSIPRFTWLNGTNLDTLTTVKILQTINCAAYQRIRNHLPCLHHCLKILATYLQQIPIKSSEESNAKKDDRTTSECSEGNAPGGAGDSCIPFPRTCGAKWCHVGTLVVFHRPPNAKRMSLKPESCTPRSLSSLATPLYISGQFRSLSPHMTTTPSPTNASLTQLLHRPPSHSITTFYFQDRWKMSSRRTGAGLRAGAGTNICHKVTLYNADSLFLLNKQLAEKYTISDMSISELCNKNAVVASSLNRLDLMQSWELAGLVASSLEQSKNDLNSNSFFSEDDTNNLSIHPFGWNIIQDLIEHYIKVSDVQMAAMLCCVFSHYYEAYMVSSKSSDMSSNSNGSNSSPYNTIHNICEMNVDGWAVPVLRHDRTSSWSDSTDINPSYFESSLQISANFKNWRNETAASPVFDAMTIQQYQHYMKTYADILHRWYLLEARAEIMKRVSSGEDTKHVGVELISECHRCRKIIREGRCMKCSLIALNCVICNIGVRGSANACLVCGHGGHTSHLEQWFSKNEICPTGCGCKCLRETYTIMDR